ncbi:protein FAR1-RELATED SEQUENCE 9-like isoform X1 [Papaver somniferum]|uniref:protein FAR1-RELATED SEQUENCE 9-like isoform X1 n=2 Tax=Papaver somniferum TaxID=3469 RepID=UPI000E700297|nr:protein FAR1-RELATED SEQUENCE 9-like isoform X1 [Papaver somniferum]
MEQNTVQQIEEDEWDTDGFVIPSLSVGESDLSKPDGPEVKDDKVSSSKATEEDEKIYLASQETQPSQVNQPELILSSGYKQWIKQRLKEAEMDAPNDGTFYKPFVGMEFDSLDESYFYYNEYARAVGFSIRRAKNRRSNIDGALIFQRFCCSKEGHRRKRRDNDDEEPKKMKDGVLVKVRRRNVRSIRVGCSAKLDVKRVTDGKWVVRKFDEEHNHECANSGEKHMLRSQRRIQSIQVDMSMSDCKIKKPEKGDVRALLNYFREMQTESPSFFYAIQGGKDDRMLNFFWADTRSRMDYGYFGDVVYFRSNYGINKYGRAFSPILGINHHLQTVLFGCAILLNENEESLTWLLETFLKAMSGRRPVAIVIDGDAAMMKAIEQVLPGTRQSLCLGEILVDASNHFSHLENMRDAFITDLKKCIYDTQWCDEFESSWVLLHEKYKLHENEWLDNLYKKRHMWAPVYSRHVFHANMMTIQCIESINSYFDGFVNEPLPLYEFLKQYDKALDHRRDEEISEDFQSLETRPVLKLDVPMEQQAADLYTRSVFKEFHKEFCESFSYIAEETARVGTNWTYAVSRWGQNRSCLVSFSSCNNDIRVNCDCQNFEFTGILCKHIFKVFTVRNIMLVPDVYIRKRWTKKAKVGVFLGEGCRKALEDCQKSQAFRFNDLCQLTFNLCAKSAISINAYQTAKSTMEMIIGELDKEAEEEVSITQPNIDHVSNLHYPIDAVNGIGSSDHLMGEDNQTLTSGNHVTMQNPQRVGDTRTGFWLRL